MPLDLDALRGRIEQLFLAPPAAYTAEDRELFAGFKDALNRGEIRAASPDAGSPTGWRPGSWGNGWRENSTAGGRRPAPTTRTGRTIRGSSWSAMGRAVWSGGTTSSARAAGKRHGP